jgi:Ca-activated chloride channel family protein
MTFLHPWVLGLALAPPVWVVRAWRRTPRRGALLLKAAGLLLAILALAEPELSVFESRMAVAILADTSASIPDPELDRVSSVAGEITSHRGRNWTQVIPFAQSTRALSEEERKNGLRLRHTAGEAGNATNLEAAVREGIATLPPGRVPRLALISDGKENLGSLGRAAWQARQLGIPIDTFALAGRPQPDLHLESVSLPGQAFTGERFPIEIVLNAPRAAEASVEISAGGKRLGSSQVQLEPGSNRLRVHASLTTAGAVDLAGAIGAEGLGSARFVSAVTLRRPRVLLLSEDPAGTEAHLVHALEAGQFEVTKTAALPASLDDFQVVVLNNWNLEGIAPARQARLEQFVKQGGGLLVIGGERNVYVERQAETAMDRTLPARLAPPRTPEGTCVVLILDKSSSMEGRKMELAKLAAIGVVQNLRPTDYVGVLIFDNSFHWSAPIRRAEERELIKRVISGISPDGGTQIAPALEEAYRRILPVNAIYKHVVLLTDGISEEGDSMALSRQASERQVTISTVGLGQDVNRAYLEKVAALAGGKSYFLNDPAGLEQILLRDVMEHTGSTAVERAIRPQVMKKAEILEGVGMEAAPALAGYVRFLAKPTADVILDVDRQDPLYVRWQYGLGRAAIFSSDAKSRWARGWVSWAGFDRFWENVFRDLLPHARAGEATAEYDSASDELVVDYRLGRQADEPAAAPDLFVFGPRGFQRPVPLEKVAGGAWRGRVRLERRQGLFRVRPVAESRAFPEVGLYRQESELSDYGSNEALLKQVAAFTGGRFNPEPRDLFDPGGRRVPSTLRLWPGLLALALLLNLLELVLRKWRGLAAAMTRRRTAPAEPAPASEHTKAAVG